MQLPVIVVAGGLGTRLGSLGKDLPKIMVPINGVPFIELQLKWLMDNGVTDITYCLGYRGQNVVDHLKTLELPNYMKIQFSWDGDIPLGTGGAIAKVARQLNSPFLVTYGDSYLQANISEIAGAFSASGFPALMTVYRNHDRFDVSNVIFYENRIKSYQKKPDVLKMDYIDYGLLGFDKHYFSRFEDQIKFDLSEVINFAVMKQELYGIEIHERFFQVGTLSGITELEDFLNAAT